VINSQGTGEGSLRSSSHKVREVEKRHGQLLREFRDLQGHQSSASFIVYYELDC
jgi:hypothetical protein